MTIAREAILLSLSLRPPRRIRLGAILGPRKSIPEWSSQPNAAPGACPSEPFWHSAAAMRPMTLTCCCIDAIHPDPALAMHCRPVSLRGSSASPGQ